MSFTAEIFVALSPTIFPFAVKSPTTVKLSSTLTVPPAESNVRLPLAVSISPTAVLPT